MLKTLLPLGTQRSATAHQPSISQDAPVPQVSGLAPALFESMSDDLYIETTGSQLTVRILELHIFDGGIVGLVDYGMHLQFLPRQTAPKKHVFLA